MACFIVPATEAVVTTVITKVAEEKEKKAEVVSGKSVVKDEHVEIKFSQKLKWLNTLLWGGSALLAFEHLWHGEITPFFPFLTAAANASDLKEMFYEMATVGVGMATIVTVAWTGMVYASNRILSRNKNKSKDSVEVTE